jgi:two-component system NtrC family sensor kinase
MGKSEDLLRKDESYQVLLQSVTDYVIAINRDYKIIMANDLFRNQFEIKPDALCFQSWKRRDTPCEECVVDQCFHDGRIRRTEQTVLLKDGREARMRIKATPVRNQQGKIVYVLETATDVTEKERLQVEPNRVEGHLEERVRERMRRLERSEERYRTLFERSSDAIFLTDSQGEILDLNQAGVALLGYESKEEVLGLGSAMEIFENREDVHRLLKTLSEQGFVTEFETRLLGRHRRPFDALMTSNVMLDTVGRITGYVLIIRDITKRKAALEQIEAQNVRLSALNAISTTISSSLDLEEVLDATTGKIRQIMGSDCVRIYLLDENRERLNLAAHQGLTSTFVQKPHVRSRAVGDGFLGETVQRGKVQVVDNLLPSADPYVNHLVQEGFKSTAYIPLVSKGEPVGVMCISSHAPFKFSDEFMDFLTAAGNQIGLAVHNAHLFQGLKKAYDGLKDAQEQVIRSEKLASLGKLSATIAHEINNPIAAVLTYIRLLKKLVDLKRLTPERIADVSRYVGVMESETERCGEIVKNLLAFSRQSKIRMEPHSIREILEKTLRLIRHDLELKEIRVVEDIDADLPPVKCDFRQIQQALLNLMSNASEAMDRRGTLRLKAGPAPMNGFVEIAVTDDGRGIPETEIKNIFEPFYTTKEEGKGVGLGLSVTYGIVTRHNGAIQVESRVGEGSTFRIQIPTA